MKPQTEEVTCKYSSEQPTTTAAMHRKEHPGSDLSKSEDDVPNTNAHVVNSGSIRGLDSQNPMFLGLFQGVPCFLRDVNQTIQRNSSPPSSGGKRQVAWARGIETYILSHACNVHDGAFVFCWSLPFL